MKGKHFNLLRWLPVAASLALVILIAAISATTIAEFKKATRWRKQAFQVILEAQAEEDHLIDAESRIRRYAADGTPGLLIEYKQDTNAELTEFSKLSELTRDNPQQQELLNDLNAALKAVFSNDNRVIGVYARQGANAAEKIDDSDEIADAEDRAVSDLERFKSKEETVLDKRDDVEQADYHRAAKVLIVGSVVAALLLVLSNYIAGREMSRRRNAERRQRELIEELQNTLAEVKTLSGLIPICGWCKKVRSDTGYWQSVEQYVRAHTDATFTHGMCPDCAEEMKAEISKANPKR